MAEEKPIHIPRQGYPELAYPKNIMPVATDSRQSAGIHILEYWRVIVARRWTVLAVVLTTMMVSLIWTFKQTPIYRAEVTIQIDRENQNILSFKDVYAVESSTDDTLRTQFEILKSRSLARRVIEDLHLDRNQEFQPGDLSTAGTYLDAIRRLVSPTSSTTADPDLLRPIIDQYLERLQVYPVRQARLVTVSFESKDPNLAARVMNAHAKHFIEQNFQYKWEATQQASDFLKQQLANLRSNLEKAEDRLQAYSREHQILFTEQGRNTATEKLQQLEEESTKAQAERFQKESYDRLVRAGNVDGLPQLLANQLLETLATRLAELQRDESELAVTFSPDYPSRKRKRSQIEQIESAMREEKERIVRTVQAEYTASVERENLLSNAVDQQRETVNRLNEEIIQYNIIKREVDSDKQLYEGLLTRLNEAGISADLRASNIRIVDTAEVPRNAIRPRKTLNVILSLFFGLLSGIGLALFQEHIDDTIKTIEDINEYLNAPTLGVVPRLQTLHGSPGYRSAYADPSKAQLPLADAIGKIDTISHEAPSSLMAEAYRSIRTSLLLSSPGRPPKLVLVTSSAPSEGKTVTAINLAISLTQVGARVALIDADMRKPRIQSVFALNDGVGLSSVLTGTASLKMAVQPCPIPNLYVIPCGAIPPNPGELLVADGFRRLIEVLLQFFDFVVLDSPPVSNVSDARVLGSMCDATILVVKAQSTSRYQAATTVAHLRDSHVRLAGVILNELDVRAGGYHAYYYKNYSYMTEANTHSA